MGEATESVDVVEDAPSAEALRSAAVVLREVALRLATQEEADDDKE